MAMKAHAAAATDHLCSRTCFQHEKQRAAGGKFKNVKTKAVLGGQALEMSTSKRAASSTAVKKEGEVDEDESTPTLLMSTLIAPKHCRFLLK